MSTAPLLGALLEAALPGLRALDLGMPAQPLLCPWLPGTLLGAADPEALPSGEFALMRRFRHPGRRPLVGFDRAADAALLADAPASWNCAPERLIRFAADPPSALPAGALLLVPPDADVCAGDPPRSRVLLLLGIGRRVDRHDLLVPPQRFKSIHAALGSAAEALASAAGGPWLARTLVISENVASVALLPQDAQAFRPPLAILAAALVHDLPSPAGSDGLDLSNAPRARILLGTTPPTRLRVFLRGEGVPSVVLFANGTRLPTTASAGAAGETRLEAEPPPSAEPAVIGLAVPEHARGAVLIPTPADQHGFVGLGHQWKSVCGWMVLASRRRQRSATVAWSASSVAKCVLTTASSTSGQRCSAGCSSGV